MDVKRIIAIYFSPNGSTREIVKKLAGGIGDYEVEEIDLTCVESRNEKREFNKDELVVIGLPVYSDRLPSISGEIFKNLQGDNTPTVGLVSYGNRDYGDALLELKNELTASNMKFISGAAMIGQHCLNKNVATGRPDESDDIKILEYGKAILNKINNIVDTENVEDVYVKGEYPYAPLKAPRVPQGDDKCIQCGDCEKGCPVNAIDKDDNRKTDGDICIYCGQCINMCPTNARDFKEESFLASMKGLEAKTRERREIEIFMD